MALAQMRERMEREFAAVRSDIARLEGVLTALQRDAAASRDAWQRVRSATGLIRELEWKGTQNSGPASCPICHGACPTHADGCGLAAVIAALRA